MHIRSIYWLLLILTVVPLLSFGQSNDRQIRNLEAFAKLYGYVRFFHPSDEAASINFNRFAIYGALRMLSVKSDEELITCLQSIFKPIAPTVNIFPSGINVSFSLKAISPPDVHNYQDIFWQHFGFNLHITNKNFSSFRTNRIEDISKAEILEVPLTKILNLERYTGKRFEFTWTASVPSTEGVAKSYSVFASVRGKNSRGFYSLNKQTIIDSRVRTFKFGGILDTNAKNFVFKIAITRDLRLSVDNVKLNISDNGRFIPVDIGITGASSKEEELKHSVNYSLSITENARSWNMGRIKSGSYIKKEIVPGITVIVPLILYGTKTHTYPIVDSVSLAKLNNDMFNSMIKDKDGSILASSDLLSIRLSDIVISWNILKHSSPYWSLSSKVPDDVLKVGFKKAFSDKTASDFLQTLKLMYEPLNDGLLSVYLNDAKGATGVSFVPLILTKSEGKVVIEKILDSTLADKLFDGDIVEAMNNVPINEAIGRQEMYLSGSPQSKKGKSLNMLTMGAKNSLVSFSIMRNGKRHSIDVRRTAPGRFNGQMYTPYQAIKNGWVSPGIYYLNWRAGKMDDYLNDLHKAKAIIFDMRNPDFKESYSPLPHLVNYNSDITFQTPIIRFPDFKDVTYLKSTVTILQDSSHFTGKVFFLVDNSTIGYAENLLNLVKEQNLGKIIGQPTAGAGGKINTFYLLGDFSITYTGMLTNFRNDGLKGINPDVSVRTTISDLSKGIDVILNKAISEASSTNLNQLNKDLSSAIK